MKAKGVDGGDDGLLEYLSDIIGTTRFEEPIQQATLSLDTLNEQVEGALVKFKHAQKESLVLKSKSEEAYKYIEWENQVARLTCQLVSCKSRVLTRAHQTMEMEIKEWSEDLVSHQSVINQEELGRVEKEFREVQEECKRVRMQAHSLTKELTLAESEEVGSKETAKFLNSKRKKLWKGREKESSVNPLL